MLFAFAVVATVFCVRLLCILYDLCNCLHCCVNDTLSILFIRLCKMSLCYEESDILFERRGGVRFTSLREFGRYVMAFLRH